MSDNKHSFKNCILLIYFNDSFLISEKDFIKKLYQKAKNKGPEFVAAIPESTRKEHNLS